MALDTGCVRGVSSLSPMFSGGNPAKGPMDSAPNRVQRAFCLSCVRGHANRFLSSTGPQRRNRWRAVAPQDPLRERPGAEPVRSAPPLLNNSSGSLAPVPPCSMLNWLCCSATTNTASWQNKYSTYPPLLIKSRGRKNGGGVLK